MRYDPSGDQCNPSITSVPATGNSSRVRRGGGMSKRRAWDESTNACHRPRGNNYDSKRRNFYHLSSGKEGGLGRT